MTMGLMPTEDPMDKVGLGHYPLLECIGSVRPVFPDSDNLAKQLTKMLRSNLPTNNVNLTKLRGIFEAGELPTSTTGQLPFEWPTIVSTTQPSTHAEQHIATGWIFVSALFEIHKWYKSQPQLAQLFFLYSIVLPPDRT